MTTDNPIPFVHSTNDMSNISKNSIFLSQIEADKITNLKKKKLRKSTTEIDVIHTKRVVYRSTYFLSKFQEK